MEEDQTLRFSLRLPKDAHDRVTASANEHGNSVNAEMLRLIELGISSEKEKAPDKTLLEQLLPPALIWRISRYKENHSLPSNEEAAKRLLKIALDERESTKDILDKLHESYQRERDLRILAREVIASHAAVLNINYGPDYVWFNTNNRESGAIDKKGNLYYSEDGREWDHGMDYYSPTTEKGGWSAPGTDLEDPIPF